MTTLLEILERDYRPIPDHKLEDIYRDLLNDSYDPVNVCGYLYPAGSALEELDPTAFRTGFNDWLDSADDQYVYVGTEYWYAEDVFAARESWDSEELEENDE